MSENQSTTSIELDTPWQIIEVKSQRRFRQFGYIHRRELVQCPGSDDAEPLEMESCYSLDTGHWIGDPRTARYLCRERGLRQIQKTQPGHCVASIGFDEAAQKWAGWSHRAVCSFGVGDRIFEEEFGDAETLYTQHGSREVVSMQDAKTAAKRFAAYVS